MNQANRTLAVKSFHSPADKIDVIINHIWRAGKMRQDRIDLKVLLQIEELEDEVAPGLMSGAGGTKPCTIVWSD